MEMMTLKSRGGEVKKEKGNGENEEGKAWKRKKRLRLRK